MFGSVDYGVIGNEWLRVSDVSWIQFCGTSSVP